MGEATASGDWLMIHSFYPDEYKTKCTSDEFIGIIFFAQALGVIPKTDGITYVLEDVSIDGDDGMVNSHFEKHGIEVELFGDQGSENDEPGFVWQDGRWVSFVSPEEMAKDNPCEVPEPEIAITVDEPTPTPTLTKVPERQSLLEQKAKTWGDAYANHDWATVHTTHSDEFKSKCSVSEYSESSSFHNARSSTGVPKGATYILDGVRIEGEYAWVDSHFEINGQNIFHDRDQYSDNEPPELIWKDGKWEFDYDPEFLALEEPCSLAPFEGLSLELPLPVASTLRGTDGTEILVTGIVENAWQLMRAARGDYADPPEPGTRFYMISVEVAYAEGRGSRNFSSLDFDLVGNNRTIYSGGCGFTPDRLDAELFPGGKTDGNICFQVDENDGGFVLIHQPEYDDETRRFLSLE